MVDGFALRAVGLILPCALALGACSSATDTEDSPDGSGARVDASAESRSDAASEAGLPPGDSGVAVVDAGDAADAVSGAADSGRGEGGGASADGAGPDAVADAGPPTWSTEFVANDGQWPVVNFQKTGGSVTFGFADPAAEDDAAVRLLFPGVAGLGSTARDTTDYASEIDTPAMFKYGTFRARLELPVCAPTEEVVTGFFTYFNDGKDENGNGITDNSEIDIEILCGNPHVVSLTIWTDYTSDSKFLAVGRQIDMATGAYSQTAAYDSYDQTPMGTLPQFVHPEFPDPSTYYEMGFDWQPAELRFFIVLGGAEITLFDFTDSQHIPALSSALIFNLWHASTHWTGDDSAASYPAKDAVALIDWARVWQ